MTKNRSFQRLDLVHGISATSQIRIIPSARPLNFRIAMDLCISHSVSNCPPFFLNGTVWCGYPFCSPALYTEVRHMFYLCEKSHMWTWCRGLQVTWRIRFWTGIVTRWQFGLHPLEIKSILCIGERIKLLFIDQNIELWQMLPSLFPLPGTPRRLYFEATISVGLVGRNWVLAKGM